MTAPLALEQVLVQFKCISVVNVWGTRYFYSSRCLRNLTRSLLFSVVVTFGFFYVETVETMNDNLLDHFLIKTEIVFNFCFEHLFFFSLKCS